MLMAEEVKTQEKTHDATHHDAPHHDTAHHHDDTTVIFGREYPIPVYTSVFLVLGVLTALEVAMFELISSNAKIPFLLAIAVAKSLLVILFYMHLKNDSRIFAFTLALPVAIALLSALFLFTVPTG